MINMNKILYAGFALLLCASCSNDNDRDITSLPEAKISLQVKASGTNKKSPLKAGTKAGTDANELAGEAYINNITAFVFSEDGSQLLSSAPFYQETTPADGELTIPNIPARAAKARIVLVGNANGALSNITSYAGLEAALCQLSSQEQDNLTMSSRVIETEESLVAGDENYIGYESMTVDNQKTASRFFSHDYWGAVVTAGNLGTSPSTPMELVVDNNTSLSEIAYRTYVMENDGSEQPTELLIKATISAKDPYQARTREFRAVINEKGLSAYGHNFVKRNYVYKISLVFDDESFKEDILYGTVRIVITVAEWNTEIIDIPAIDS